MNSDRIEITRYSTADLPPDERYAAWLRHDWPRQDSVFRTHPSEPFDTDFSAVQLGEIGLLFVEITAMRWERRLVDIRSSDFDPIVVNMMTRGLAQGDLGGRAFRQEAGTFHFHDLAKPSIHVSSASRTFTLIVPRPVAIAWFGAIDDLHGLVVSDPFAAVLIALAEAIWRAVPTLSVASAPALGRSFMELLTAALAEVRPTLLQPATAEAALRRRAEAEIERRLRGSITIAELCDALKVSRARLFAVFHAEGGVLSHVATMRLERARAALADLERAEPIGQIAERLGFSEASHLSRSFRQRYGMTPRDYRRMVAGDRAANGT